MRVVAGLIAVASLAFMAGTLAASGRHLNVAKAYFCGYVRGMKFVADKAGIVIGEHGIQGCEQFDDLEGP